MKMKPVSHSHGRAGKNLDGMIEYMGLSGEDYAVINTIKSTKKTAIPLKVKSKPANHFLKHRFNY
ncbi:MAG: hypothetical protein R2741_12195 [Methanolobus sp.]